MRQNLTNRTTRRRLGMTAAGIVAVGALAVPGVAWAADVIPQGAALQQATVESTPAAATTPAEGIACSDGVVVTGEALQKLIDEGLSPHATAEQQEALVKTIKTIVPAGAADTVSIESLKEAVATGSQAATGNAPAATGGAQAALVEAQPAPGNIAPQAC
ncbi:hypothetical protein [Rhodococcus daqingensis]|uniref:Secreted protein n=1 Tax=Rhodococcus daqingensis TaxID=2479363 RepID=A0ABW2RXA6_9NOCA